MGMTNQFRFNPYDSVTAKVFVNQANLTLSGSFGQFRTAPIMNEVPVDQSEFRTVSCVSSFTPSDATPEITPRVRNVSLSSGSSQSEYPTHAIQSQPKRSAKPRVPQGTLHRTLRGQVTFVPYPTQSISKPEPAVPKHAMSRVFIGQLPYQVTDMQLDWLCQTFGDGANCYFPERIMKHDAQRGTKMPTGCIHAYCDPQAADFLMAGIHKRLLIDDTGVWYAQNQKEQEVLTNYTQAMKKDRSLRIHNRPYDTVVVQFATSRYMPSQKA